MYFSCFFCNTVYLDLYCIMAKNFHNILARVTDITISLHKERQDLIIISKQLCKFANHFRKCMIEIEKSTVQ